MRNELGLKIFNFKRGSYIFNEGGSPFNFMWKQMRSGNGWMWYVYLFGWRKGGVAFRRERTRTPAELAAAMREVRPYGVLKVTKSEMKVLAQMHQDERHIIICSNLAEP